MAYVRLSKVPAIDTALKLSGVAVVMFAFVFVVMVPLYNVLCDVLGINGKTAGSAYTAVPVMIDESREITVQFVAIKNNEMPWGFSPDERIMRVYPGAANGTIFRATNPTTAPMVAQAIPSISPSRAAPYFHKTECFCFENQPLAAGEQADLKLIFIIDPDLPEGVNSVTLSYTIFDITDRMANPIAQLQ
mgnify:CR=1 FL=1